MTTLLVKLIRTGATMVRHSKYVTFQTVEVAASRKTLGAILTRLRGCRGWRRLWQVR